MCHIHWLGAGLSSVPGIRRLALLEYPISVWNRTLAKAQAAIAGIHSADAVAWELDWTLLASGVKPGDVVVSMLPASMHLRAAELCLEKGAHFVTSSYISEEMTALDGQVRARQLCFVNECGLDPGLDHLFAHALLDSTGNERGSAMARLVSIPVSLVVEAILNGELETGIMPVPSDMEHVDRWIELLCNSGENIVVNKPV